MTVSVLVVDDSGFFRKRLTEILTASGQIKVIGAATNGREGVELAEKLRPDVITMDYEMPVMDGLEFLRHAKLKTRAKICMLSSVTVQGSPHAAKARELGADGVVAKPSGTVSHDLEEKTGQELRETMRRLVAA